MKWREAGVQSKLKKSRKKGNSLKVQRKPLKNLNKMCTTEIKLIRQENTIHMTYVIFKKKKRPKDVERNKPTYSQ